MLNAVAATPKEAVRHRSVAWCSADGTCYCLLRRETGTATGQLGGSKPPYTDWSWKDLGQCIGGPALTRLPDGRYVAAVRMDDKTLASFDTHLANAASFFTTKSSARAEVAAAKTRRRVGRIAGALSGPPIVIRQPVHG